MDLDLSKIKNVHFIGIGGIGISAIARMMLRILVFIMPSPLMICVYLPLFDTYKYSYANVVSTIIGVGSKY